MVSSDRNVEKEIGYTHTQDGGDAVLNIKNVLNLDLGTQLTRSRR